MQASTARFLRSGIYHALVLALALYGSAAARTFYLSPSGDDNSPVEQGAVFRTLAAAVNHLWGGDTLIIRNGNYQGGVHIRRGCKPEAPLVIKAEGPYAVIRGSGEDRDGLTLNDCCHVVLDGLNVAEAARGGIVISHSKFITVRNCTSFNNGKWGMFTDHASDFLLEGNECYGSWREHGIYHSNSGDNFIIRNNILHHNSGCGIHVNGDPEYGGDGVISFGIIEGNICYKNGRPLGGAGINMTHVQDVIVRNNLLYHNYAGGITFYQDTGTFEQGSKRALITGNTVVYR
ncbi:MAG: right-handed parallel beta-helix repeat-containing protein, partial [Candidatus Glassbacteria bacterium]|nr:right-handed parallel beta-helix repeat-containing protein [Candidatus Glassbacteria bacterium]